MKIEVSNESDYTVLEKQVKELTEQVIGREPEIPPNLSIAFVPPDAIAKLNQEYYGRDGETDVLAFDYGDNFAEVILNPSRLEQQAGELGHSPGVEAGAVLIHGLLHLAGYDHTKPGEEGEHFQRQEELSLELVQEDLILPRGEKQKK